MISLAQRLTVKVGYRQLDVEKLAWIEKCICIVFLEIYILNMRVSPIKLSVRNRNGVN